MKRAGRIVVVAVVMVMLVTTQALAQLQETKIKGDMMGMGFDRMVYYQPQAMRTYVDGEHMSHMSGSDFKYDAKAGTVVMKKDDTTIAMTVGNPKTATVNGKEVEIDAGPLTVGEGKMLVLPVRFVLESFGYKVDWHGDMQHVMVEKK